MLECAFTTTLPQMALHTAQVLWADNELKTGEIIGKLKDIKRSTWGSCLWPPTDGQNARTVPSVRHAPTASSAKYCHRMGRKRSVRSAVGYEMATRRRTELGHPKDKHFTSS